MKPYYSDSHVTIFHGDCRDVLPMLEPVETCITDPPYGLGFMGKDWDHGVPGEHFWRLISDALLPGATCLAFGGTRTHHRLMVAIEDAGFEIRDCMMWLYGSGFPKSLDVGKAIDTRKDWAALRALQGAVRSAREVLGISQSEAARRMGLIAEGEDLGGGGFMWFETGMRVPTREQYPKLKTALGLDDASDAAFEAAERESLGVRTFGDSAVWGNASGTQHLSRPINATAKLWDGWGTALKPAWEPIILAMKPLAGTFAENALKHGVAGVNVDGARIGTAGRPLRGEHGDRPSESASSYDLGSGHAIGATTKGRWPANVVLDNEAAALLDEESGELTSGANPTSRGSDKFRETYGEFRGQRECAANRGKDSGGASRFFYTGKASVADRGEGNDHPTVKPQDLMRWLCVLTATPTGGTVLDPFMGSGSTIYAAKETGRHSIGVELEERYCEIAAQRLCQGVLDLREHGQEVVK